MISQWMSGSVTSGTDVTDVTHVGLDRHIYEQSTAKQNDDPNGK